MSPRDARTNVPITVHPIVARLAQAAQAALERNADKRHWKDEDMDNLYGGIILEAEELLDATGSRAWEEAADVALYAAFYAAKKEAKSRERDTHLEMHARDTVVVTRHSALVLYLREIGLVDDNTKVIEHASKAEIEGKRVIGNLPTHLAAHAASVVEIPLDIPRELRGKELSVEQVRTLAGGPAEYIVVKVGGG
jgi:putative CRISPR-associated protein (TIGR02620 family)